MDSSKRESPTGRRGMASLDPISALRGWPTAACDGIARVATATLARRRDALAATGSPLRGARSTVCGDRAASRRVLTDVSTAWHAPAMLAGTLRARSVARLEDSSTSSHVRRRTWPIRISGCRNDSRRATSCPKWVRGHVQRTVGSTVTGRWKASFDRVERSPAVIDSRNEQPCAGVEEELQEV